MREKIRKGLKVQIDFAHLPVSVVGTIDSIDSRALIVLIASDEARARQSMPLNEQRNVRVSATAEDALYCFTSTLLRTSGLLFYLSPPVDIQRLQRREHVREQCLIDVEFVTPGDDAGPAKPKRGTAVNISCGGLQMVYDGRIEVGDPVEVSIKFLQSGPPMQLAGTVVRTERFSRFGRDLSRVGLRLVGLTRSAERRLLQFIRALQTKAPMGAARDVRRRRAAKPQRRRGAVALPREAHEWRRVTEGWREWVWRVPR
jgi:c-di-GMP-binding flagellar brake protein YcgR